VTGRSPTEGCFCRAAESRYSKDALQILACGFSRPRDHGRRLWWHQRARLGLRIYDSTGHAKGEVTATEVIRSSVRTGREPGGKATAYLSFALTRRANQEIQSLTCALAQRGARLHQLRHFAFEVSGHVYAHPYIDYRVTPDGFAGKGGMELPGLSPKVARRIAGQLRAGAAG
jgi:hypothetical protein